MVISDGAVRAGFDALPGQVAILDETGRILVTNEAWREFGVANGGETDNVGQNYLAVCDASTDEKAVRVSEGIRALLDGAREHVSVEYPCHGPDSERWFTMRALSFEDDGEQYVLVMHVDITDRKLAELELREKNDRLETVAGVLSHDLRNPLNVAVGRANMIESEHADPLVRSLERMETMVSDALVLARRDEVQETRPVELADSAEGAWQQVGTDDAELSVTGSVSFEADPTLLGHVYENLFRNAVEHGATTITVGGLEGGFHVEDDGSGIPADERESVFDPGYSTGDGGTGLGLAIVEQVVEAHGWSIRVTESESGGWDAPGVTSDGGPDAEVRPTGGARFEVTF